MVPIASSVQTTTWVLPLVDTLAAGLSEQGFCALPAALPRELASDVESELRERFAQPSPAQLGSAARQPHAAGIGRGGGLAVNREIRGDLVAWLDPASATLGLERLLASMEALREALAASLLLPLRESEFMSACYPKGARYLKHLDQHRDSDQRLLTVIAYFNAGWQSGDGGELSAWLPDGRVERIAPASGTLVVFRSDTIAHEVAITQRRRFSVTGWFRRSDLPLAGIG